MKSKKKVKILIITFSSIFLVALICAAYFLFAKPSNSPLLPNGSSNSNRFIAAQTAIFNERFSINYNGTYKFSRINYVYLSNLDDETIAKVYEYYKVDDTMGLIGKLTSVNKNKTTANKEVLIIEDCRFQFNHNTKPYSLGSVYGNDDLSVFYNSSNERICSISLTRHSEEELKNISTSENVSYFGSELFLTSTISLEINEDIISFDVVYVYNLTK